MIDPTYYMIIRSGVPSGRNEREAAESKDNDRSGFGNGGRGDAETDVPGIGRVVGCVKDLEEVHVRHPAGKCVISLRKRAVHIEAVGMRPAAAKELGRSRAIPEQADATFVGGDLAAAERCAVVRDEEGGCGDGKIENGLGRECEG
jgi:hypothetical protein